MNNQFLLQALDLVKNPNILVNMVSQRVRQLGQGHKALVAVEGNMTYMDIALKEIADGKIQYEIDMEMPRVEAKPRRKK